MMPRKTPFATLPISLIQLLLIQHAQSCSYEYEISIYGDIVKGGGSECFESDKTSGIVAEVSSDLDNLLVWDEDAPCGGDDESFIHYSGKSYGFGGMSAGKGDLVHTYRAAVFPDGLPVPAGTAGCYAFSTKTNSDTYTCLEKWKVARYGNTCPQHIPSRIILVSVVSALVAVVLMGVLCRRCRTRKQPNESGDSTTNAEIESTNLSPKIV